MAIHKNIYKKRGVEIKEILLACTVESVQSVGKMESRRMKRVKKKKNKIEWYLLRV